MFIFAATVLSVFNIEKVVINGVVQEPKNAFSSGVLVYVPLPFFPFHRSRTTRLFAQLEPLYDLQTSAAVQERTQAALLQGRVPRPLARPSRVLDYPPV
jgi:hypothetical protein